jgi:hypothetical protein
MRRQEAPTAMRSAERALVEMSCGVDDILVGAVGTYRMYFAEVEQKS